MTKYWILDRGVEFLDKELEQVYVPIQHAGKPRVVDKLVKVCIRGKKDECALLHVEVQGKYSKDFGERMHAYYYRLMDKYNMHIFSYAIFTERTAKLRPDTFIREFLGTSINYRYNIFKVSTATDKELLNHENPFAIAIMASRIANAGHHIKNAFDRDMLRKDLKIKLIKHLISKRLDIKREKILFNFIHFYILLEFEETRLIYKQELDYLTKNKNTMGLEEQILEIIKQRGIEKGKAQGKGEIKDQLAIKLVKNLGFTDKQAANLIGVSISYVAKLRKEQAVA